MATGIRDLKIVSLWGLVPPIFSAIFYFFVCRHDGQWVGRRFGKDGVGSDVLVIGSNVRLAMRKKNVDQGVSRGTRKGTCMQRPPKSATLHLCKQHL
jgi:hypothetical protein